MSLDESQNVILIGLGNRCAMHIQKFCDI